MKPRHGHHDEPVKRSTGVGKGRSMHNGQQREELTHGGCLRSDGQQLAAAEQPDGEAGCRHHPLRQPCLTPQISSRKRAAGWGGDSLCCGMGWGHHWYRHAVTTVSQ